MIHRCAGQEIYDWSTVKICKDYHPVFHPESLTKESLLIVLAQEGISEVAKSMAVLESRSIRSSFGPSVNYLGNKPRVSVHRRVACSLSGPRPSASVSSPLAAIIAVVLRFRFRRQHPPSAYNDNTSNPLTSRIRRQTIHRCACTMVYPRGSGRALLLSASFGLVRAVAVPEPTPVPAKVEVRAPVVTPALIRFDGRGSYIQKRNIISDIANGVQGIEKSWASVLGTDLPSFFTEGIPGWFDSVPTGDQVLSSAGISRADLDAKPTEVLNIPPYGNWTDLGWNVRFHGNVYKIPDISQSKIDELANVFLIDTSVEQLPDDQKANARNLTRSIFIVQQSDQNVSLSLEPAPLQGGDGEPGGGNAIPATGGVQNFTLPYPTTEQGDFDVFVPIELNGLTPGNETNNVQRLNVYTNGTLTGNATAFLVPSTGITFISDIDDILRVTKIYNPKEGLLNSFARNFTPWENMPDIYANWSRSLPPNTHFHYLTTTPEQATRNYMDFIYKTYPGGSFDTRPLNFSDVSATLSIRKFLLDKIFATFPDRKFVLIADTSNSDVMKAYPELAHQHPNQVQCILLRNTSATDSEMWFPYNTAGFEGLNSKNYMFFRHAEDLMGLDIAGGQCLNESVPQNVTFSRQAEILGIHGSGAVKVGGSKTLGFVVAFVAAMCLVL
ncbi:hypothetical protein IAQ61_006324 [Plenodomus lingam]|uniref:uncharacterized protein n=1 Tax=Leptosphaeria maculans TaxID=5022 RepID=UPI003330A49F|nr:hypothetical protein IAQ61_006324 [Plenodomus lingam]